MFKSISAIIALILLTASSTQAYKPIGVADMTFEISPQDERVFYYGFAAGDTVVLSAKAVKGKDISGIYLREWPSAIRFEASAVEEIKKKVAVPKTAVYVLRVNNSAVVSTKTYQIRMSRIPTREDKLDFNTAVVWDTLQDTTYTTVVESILVKVDTIPEEITSTQKHVSGSTRSYMQITFPERYDYWAYWIGADQKANEGLQQMSEHLPEAATILGITNPVAVFAIGLLPSLFRLDKGQDISCYFIPDQDNLQRFLNNVEDFQRIKGSTRIVTDYGKMSKPQEGTFYLGLCNRHSLLAEKTVTVKIVGVKKMPRYDYRDVRKRLIHRKLVPVVSE